MALCDNSLVELNSHFSSRTFEMRRFRPVIQIGGAPAFDEDMWAELKIGDVIFSCFKPCTRFVLRLFLLPLFFIDFICQSINRKPIFHHI